MFLLLKKVQTVQLVKPLPDGSNTKLLSQNINNFTVEYVQEILHMFLVDTSQICFQTGIGAIEGVLRPTFEPAGQVFYNSYSVQAIFIGYI